MRYESGSLHFCFIAWYLEKAMATETECRLLANNDEFLKAAECYKGIKNFENAKLNYSFYASKLRAENYRKAIEIYLTIARLGDELGRLDWKGEALNEIGRIYASEAGNAQGNSKNDLFLQAIGFFEKASSAYEQGAFLYEAGSMLLAAADINSSSLKNYQEALSLIERTIEIGLKARDNSLLHTAFDQAGKRHKNLKDCNSAIRCWREAEKYAKLLNNKYVKPRCAEIKLSIQPAKITINNKNPNFMDIPGKPNSAYYIKTVDDDSYRCQLTAKLSEPEGRVANCRIRFSVPKAFGFILINNKFSTSNKADGRTNKEGIASATFIASGNKFGKCKVTVTDTTGAKETLDLLVSRVSTHIGMEIQQLRWIHPNPAGLDGMAGEGIHWKRQENGSGQGATVFGCRGLGKNGIGKQRMQIELGLKLGSGQNMHAIPKAVVRGRASFTDLLDSSGNTAKPVHEINFTSDDKFSIAPGELKLLAVFSDGLLPGRIGKYKVTVNWEYARSGPLEDEWLDIGKTENEIYVTWKQPLPAVMISRKIITGSARPGSELTVQSQIKKQQLEVPYIYKKCLEYSTQGIYHQNYLSPDYVSCEPYPQDQKAAMLERTRETEILNSMLDFICDTKMFKEITRSALSDIVPLVGVSLDHQAVDILEQNEGDCGDWACFFHDLAAAQGISVCICVLGKSGAVPMSSIGENFCMYPDSRQLPDPLDEDDRYPLIYDAFLTHQRKFGVGGTGKRRYSLKQGGWKAYAKFLGWKGVEFWLHFNVISQEIEWCESCEIEFYSNKLTHCTLCGSKLIFKKDR